MRNTHTPLAAAILLAGCGSADTDGDGKISAAEAIAEAKNATVEQRPGMYQITFELLDFQASGVPEEAKQRVRNAIANGLGGGRFQCETAEDVVDAGAGKMIEELAQGRCTLTAFDVSADSYSATADCAGGPGGPREIELDGTMTTESSTATAVVKEEVPGVGEATTTVRINSRRFGECAR